MTGNHLAALLLALLCAPRSGCVCAAGREDPRTFPAPDKDGTAAAGNEPAKVSDGMSGENGTPAARGADAQGIEVLREGKAREGKETKDEVEKKIPKVDSKVEATVSQENAASVEHCAENRCDDGMNNFVACLRVLGNDSTLSLLIFNTRAGSLTVNILTPEHVVSEQTSVVLKEKGHQEVLVMVGAAAAGAIINLTAGDAGQCQLRFASPVVPSRGKLLYPASYVYLGLAALALSVAAWLTAKVRRARRSSRAGNRKLEGGAMPVSSGDGGAAGWDEGWEGSWGSDDEETPRTPSKALQSPSLKRLAPRRSSKLEHRV